MAVGRHSRAVKSSNKAPEQSDNALALRLIRGDLARLVALMEDERSYIDPSAKEAVKMVASEAGKPAPNKLVMASLLDGAATAVKSITSIATALTSVKSLIDAF
jgi:hypothetical protein